MDLSVGNVFPAPQISQRLGNQLGHIERAARRAVRKATTWLAQRRVWASRVPVPANKNFRQLSPELSAVQREILLSTGLNIAIGAACSPGVARLASRCAGRTGVRVVEPGQERAFLAPLPLNRLPGISAPTVALFHSTGLTTIGELQRVPKAALQSELGEWEGSHVWTLARGLDRIETPSVSLDRTDAQTV